MNERDRRLHARIAQVGEVLIELHRRQHPLVDQRLVGEARDVPVLRAADRRDANFVVGALADHVELALELGFVGGVFATLDENLADKGLALARSLAEHGVVDRHRARTEIDLPLGLHDTREHLFDPTALGRIARHENETTGVASGLRQGDVGILGGILKKAVRHLHQNAGAVARVDLATAGATMV